MQADGEYSVFTTEKKISVAVVASKGHTQKSCLQISASLGDRLVRVRKNNLLCRWWNL